MHLAVEHKTTVSGRRFTIRGSLFYLIFCRLVKYGTKFLKLQNFKIDLSVRL